MVPEASYEEHEGGIVPAGEGWFVLNAKAARWFEGDFGAYTRFEGPASHFPSLGINIGVLAPGSPPASITARTSRKASSSSQGRASS